MEVPVVWMTLIACGGPLALPGALDVSVRRIGCGGDSQMSFSDGGDRGDVTNRSGDERAVVLESTIDDQEDVEGYDGVVADLNPVPPKGSSFDLGDGESHAIEAAAKLYCIDGEMAPTGSYRRDVVITSTDLLGGDLVEQTVTVVVHVED